MGKTVSSNQQKQFLLKAMEFFFKNLLPRSFDNGFHQQKTLNTRIIFHLEGEDFTAFVSVTENQT